MSPTNVPYEYLPNMDFTSMREEMAEHVVISLLNYPREMAAVFRSGFCIIDASTFLAVANLRDIHAPRKASPLCAFLSAGAHLAARARGALETKKKNAQVSYCRGEQRAGARTSCREENFLGCASPSIGTKRRKTSD